ncbi:unnamed protein product [Medioppia subpectinata]|uniref:Uncharacterized protein n=1 Tax=Medioppia subpectinata TaxID=1979941 RepID=A0A7R9L1Y8_9ACAR|nr:unnamed protein product [Medioppia subpectinata]CAG2113819.1 unnamed protein product [Medioppia subpectinata]
MKVYFRAEESGLSGSEREILYRFCSQYAGELLPHLGRCFDRILPMSSVANRLGVSAIEFAKVKDQFPRVRVDTIADSVNRLLPNTALSTAGDPTSTPTTGAIVSTLSETTIGDSNTSGD